VQGLPDDRNVALRQPIDGCTTRLGDTVPQERQERGKPALGLERRRSIVLDFRERQLATGRQAAAKSPAGDASVTRGPEQNRRLRLIPRCPGRTLAKERRSEDEHLFPATLVDWCLGDLGVERSYS
jgi:hypothetical protein